MVVIGLTASAAGEYSLNNGDRVRIRTGKDEKGFDHCVGYAERLPLPLPQQSGSSARIRLSEWRLALVASHSLTRREYSMTAPIAVSAKELQRTVYVAVAGARDDAETDILAGMTVSIVAQRPDISTDELSNAVAALRDTLAANRPERVADFVRDSVLLMVRLLTRVVPHLTSPTLRSAARDYTRSFLGSFRRGTNSLQQVAPLDLQFDRFGEVSRFRSEIWTRLYDQARSSEAIAEAVDSGPIAESLGVRTSQDAATMLESTRLEPLATFVAELKTPDGGLVVPREQIDATLTSASARVLTLSSAYAANAAAVDKAQQKACDKTDGDTPTDATKLSDFEQAIKDAEKVQKELDEVLKQATKGVKGTFAVLSFAAGQFGDNSLASSIDDYANVLVKMLEATRDGADAAMTIAKAIAKLKDINQEQILVGAAVGFGFALIAVAIQLSGIFGQEKPVTQVILEQLQEIRKQIVELRDEMRARFDRVEKRINKVFTGILNRLAELDFDLGQIEANVDELQLALYDLHSEVQRLNSNVRAFLQAANRRDLVETINGSLRFRDRTGEDLDLDSFLLAENRFFSWGHDHAKDELQAGLEQRSFSDDDLFDELSSAPLAANINYVRAFPAERFNLPALSPVRLANPFDWIIAAEAYAQLHEESSTRTESGQRVADLIAVGDALGTSLSRIANKLLLGALSEHYIASFAALQQPIAAVEAELRLDPDTGLHGIDLFGGPEQEPNQHALDAQSFDDLRRCDGRSFDASHDTVPVLASIGTGFDYSSLRPFMIASNLSQSKVPGVADGLARLSACVQADWLVQSSADGPFNKVIVIYQLVFAVRINYGDAPVFVHSFKSSEILQLLVPRDDFENGTFDPAKAPGGKDPHSLLVGGTNLWFKLDTLQATHSLVDAPLRAATVTSVRQKLTLMQRAFYAEVARRFTLGGDPVQRAGEVLSGSKLLWQSFVMAGLPLRIESNDVLRSLLFGAGAILGGHDVDGEDGLLDDVQDLYRFFGSRPEDPPASNIAGEIEALARGRAGRLSALLAEVVAAIEAGGDAEAPEIFAPTLLRLQLITTS